jgi:hypothetical protein
MGIETFNTINEGINLSLMLMVNTIVLISLTCALGGLVIYLAGIVALCFENKRQSKIAPRITRHTLSPKILKSEICVPNTQVRTNY